MTTPRRVWVRALRQVFGIDPWIDESPRDARAHLAWWGDLGSISLPRASPRTTG